MNSNRGRQCIECQKGTYDERNIYNDWDGTLTCDNCGHTISFDSYRQPKKTPMNTDQLPCFMCGRPLYPSFEEITGIDNQPMGGLGFSARGHYGSGYFDPISNDYAALSNLLEIAICDSCLFDHRDRTRFSRVWNEQHKEVVAPDNLS